MAKADKSKEAGGNATLMPQSAKALPKGAIGPPGNQKLKDKLTNAVRASE